MRPDVANTTGGVVPETKAGGFDEWRALQKSTHERRADLIADIVGHPREAPSVRELDYLNPDIGKDAIRRHLRVLRDVGVVEELVVEPGDRVRGYPYKFYTLTEPARALFDRNDLFPRDAWRRQYARVQKTGEIKEIEEMPRPSLEER